MPESIDLFVCVTCRPAGADPASERPGARLHSRLQAMLPRHACAPEVRLQGIECFAVCQRPCTVAVSAPGKWGYVIGDLDVDADAQVLLDYVATYAATPGGTPPLKSRPPAIRRGTIARIPPRSL